MKSYRPNTLYELGDNHRYNYNNFNDPSQEQVGGLESNVNGSGGSSKTGDFAQDLASKGITDPKEIKKMDFIIR